MKVIEDAIRSAGILSVKTDEEPKDTSSVYAKIYELRKEKKGNSLVLVTYIAEISSNKNNKTFNKLVDLALKEIELARGVVIGSIETTDNETIKRFVIEIYASIRI